MEQSATSPSLTTQNTSSQAVLPTTIPINNNPSLKNQVSLPAHLFYQTTLGLILIILITPITYRACQIVINATTHVLQDREYIIENGVSYSPVTYITRLSEQPNPKEIYISNKDIVRNIPNTIGSISTLNGLFVYHNPIRKLPDTIGNLTSLRYIRIHNTLLNSLPITLANNQNLVDLSLSGNKITKLPDIFDSFSNMEVLNLAHNNLTSLPPSIGNMPKLVLLDLTGNQFTSFPKHLPPNLRTLYIGGNKIPLKELEEAQLRNAYTDLFIYF